MSRTERLLILIDLLRTRKSPVTAEQMATRLGVSDRSIYRDIETLRLLGAPIDAQAGIGFILRPGFLLPPMMLTGEELDALTLGVSWVQQNGDPALAEAAATALAKINTVLPVATDELPSLVSGTQTASLPDPLTVVAIRLRRKIAVSYQDLNGATNDRVLWPIALVYFDGVRLLGAWCEKRAAFRHFRADRLMTVMIMDDRYPERRSSLFKRWREQDRPVALRS